MLFGIDQKRPAKINGNSAQRPVQRNTAPARPVTNTSNTNKPPVKPVQRGSTATGAAMPQQRPPVRGAGYTQIKKAPVTAANVSQRKPYPATNARPMQRVPGSPYYKPGARTPGTAKPNLVQPAKGDSYSPAARRIMYPTAKYAYNYPRTSRPIAPASVGKSAPARAYRGPLVVRRAQQIPGRRGYYPGRLINQPYYKTSYTRPPGNTNVTVNTPGRYVPSYGYCVPQSPLAQVSTIAPGNQPVTTSAPTPVGIKKPACHTCGSRTKGCTTLSRFARNSAQVNASHKLQIREMALNILRNHINTVIATGHTDKSGSNSYNKALGARRAGAVIRELRRQLAILKPNAHKNLFWKIVTRGEERPISRTDAAANRRVHLCVRKVRSAA